MNEQTIILMEIVFNLSYLIIIWWVVIAMWRQKDVIFPPERSILDLFIWAFALLALGDTGHVGFRLVAYLLGGLGTQVSIGGLSIGLVGLGALMTAITVSIFYVFMLFIWRARYHQRLGWFGISLLIAMGVRILIMLHPENQWALPTPPQPWSIYRNLPLTVVGLGSAYLILKNSISKGDTTFTWIGVMILTSFAFYIPVILFVQKLPIIGMLMIPKTIAYVVIAFLAYAELIKNPRSVEAHLGLIRDEDIPGAKLI